MAQGIFAKSWAGVTGKYKYVETVQVKQGVNSADKTFNLEITLATEFSDGMTCTNVVDMPYPIALEFAKTIIEHIGEDVLTK